MTAASPPSTAVIRVSRANFDPARFEEVEQMTRDTGSYLIPAIGRLGGLIAYYAGASVDGSMVHVSLWQTDDHRANGPAEADGCQRTQRRRRGRCDLHPDRELPDRVEHSALASSRRQRSASERRAAT